MKDNSPDASLREAFANKADASAYAAHEAQEGSEHEAEERDEASRKNWGSPNSGARKMAGKSCEPDANLKFADKRPEEVRTLPVEGDNKTVLACVKEQVEGTDKIPNSNPKKRPGSNSLNA